MTESMMELATDSLVSVLLIDKDLKILNSPPDLLASLRVVGREHYDM